MKLISLNNIDNELNEETEKLISFNPKTFTPSKYTEY